MSIIRPSGPTVFPYVQHWPHFPPSSPELPTSVATHHRSDGLRPKYTFLHPPINLCLILPSLLFTQIKCGAIFRHCVLQHRLPSLVPQVSDCPHLPIVVRFKIWVGYVRGRTGHRRSTHRFAETHCTLEYRIRVMPGKIVTL